MERLLLGIKLIDKVRLNTIRTKTGVNDAVSFAKSLKWRWAGHVSRREDNRWSKLLTDWLPRDCKRARGRQRVRWEDELKDIDILWRRNARDRKQWKIMGEAHAQKWVP